MVRHCENAELITGCGNVTNHIGILKYYPTVVTISDYDCSCTNFTESTSNSVMVGGLGGHLSGSGTRMDCEREILEINRKMRQFFMMR